MDTMEMIGLFDEDVYLDAAPVRRVIRLDAEDWRLLQDLATSKGLTPHDLVSHYIDAGIEADIA